MKLNYLLIFIPIAILAKIFAVPGWIIFILSALSIIPLAKLIGDSTEIVSSRLGTAWGGLLNATFGNATELLIGIIALSHGLITVVQASITGSIIGNLLLVSGTALIVGGWNRKKQTFQRTAVLANASTLLLAAIALIIPALFAFSGGTHIELAHLSAVVAVLMILGYIAMLRFSLVTHKHLYTEDIAEEHHVTSITNHIIVLVLSTLAVAGMSELLVGSIEPLVHTLHWSELFVGAIFVAIIGNAAEHASAITMAIKNRMDLSLQISVGSSIQIALLIAPALVLISFLFKTPMGLLFTTFEIGAILFSILITILIVQDGESNWLEGTQLLLVYIILVVAFFFLK